jgi:hypothetical protein
VEDKPVIEEFEFKTDYLLNSEIEEKIASDTTENAHFGPGFKFQIAAADYATKGAYRNALASWDSAMTPSIIDYEQLKIDSIQRGYKTINATDYIIEKSKSSEILIINEAHHNSMHRVFTRTLLQGLYDNGYRLLGLEALGNGQYIDSLLNSRKYPIQSTGYYTKDPQFGNLIRAALDIGFHVFPYESGPGQNGKEREIAQAKNIKKVMDARPNEKILIHCGFGHVLEGDYEAWGKTMAGRLTEYTGLNPLTVHQVQFSEKSKTEYSHPMLKALEIDEPTVLIDKQINPFKYQWNKSWTDIAVFHPSTSYLEGRPHWLFKNGVQKVPIPISELNLEFPVFVMAYVKGEDVNTAVPTDLTEIEDIEEKAVLALNSGTYNIVVTNKQGDSRKFEIAVD